MTEKQKKLEEQILDFLLNEKNKASENYRTVLINYKNWRSVIEQQEAAEAQRIAQEKKAELEATKAEAERKLKEKEFELNKTKTETELKLKEKEIEFNKAKAEAELDLEAERNAIALRKIESDEAIARKDRIASIIGGAAIFGAGIASTEIITRKTEDSILPRESMSERNEMMKAIAKKLFKK